MFFSWRGAEVRVKWDALQIFVTNSCIFTIIVFLLFELSARSVICSKALQASEGLAAPIRFNIFTDATLAQSLRRLEFLVMLFVRRLILLYL